MQMQRSHARKRRSALITTVSAMAASLMFTGCVSFGNRGEESAAWRAPTGAYSVALAQARNDLRAAPQDLDALLRVATYQRYNGDAEGAAALLDENAGLHGENWAFLTELGTARLAAGDRDGAEDALTTALTRSEGNWRAFSLLGVAYDLDERYDAAATSYEMALKFCPQSPSIKNNRGLSAARSGDIDGAIAWLTAALADQPDSRVIRNNYDLFQDVRANCETCSPAEIRELTTTLAPQDWTGGAGVTCDAITAAQLRDTLAAQSFVDVRVEFEFDSDVLLPGAKATLDQVALALSSDEFFAEDFVLEGHADAVGTEAYNQDLSERRAASVRRYLVEFGGVTMERLSSIGFGETRLLEPENPTSGVNRRVRVTLVR